MSLETPDKIYREDVLLHAYALARANAGAPGVDGVTFEQIDASGVDAWLAGLREELRLEDLPIGARHHRRRCSISTPDSAHIE